MEDLRVGFTGTRDGMTAEQVAQVRKLLSGVTHFHHGDCIGADVKAAQIAKHKGCVVVAHPPTDESMRAFHKSDLILPACPYIERNHDIVDSTVWVIACPKENSQVLRSGTWATIRYAKRMGKTVQIVIPSGKIITCNSKKRLPPMK